MVEMTLSSLLLTIRVEVCASEMRVRLEGRSVMVRKPANSLLADSKKGTCF